eukprot:CAMPEP_0175964274 /NCGR_PEP_ID=MMETSP0108-20121206/37470_1 /TAXON_ID=195067 ORGANISM="Goniomonas pacifica, Strain CCMP1869" /NCGR_SAMPLE_ID=MMETSP0108 /ASSEMBLY_ACC=CAM_ASM_000204 /LENGTH=218 /DNA_ID=CAMNT_0017292237 /DNA_START=1 /DNA_END=655 /DNA_ORIENTATION=+
MASREGSETMASLAAADAHAIGAQESLASSAAVAGELRTLLTNLHGVYASTVNDHQSLQDKLTALEQEGAAATRSATQKETERDALQEQLGACQQEVTELRREGAVARNMLRALVDLLRLASQEKISQVELTTIAQMLEPTWQAKDVADGDVQGAETAGLVFARKRVAELKATSDEAVKLSVSTRSLAASHNSKIDVTGVHAHIFPAHLCDASENEPM